MHKKKEKIPAVVISATNPDPMYKQVTDRIGEAIAKGALPGGTKLPSIRDMARRLALSPITIRRAYHDLEKEGYLITRAGLGSFVAGIDREELRSRKVEEVRREIAWIVETAGMFGISSREIKRIVEETDRRARRIGYSKRRA
jgi:GntR family transcriptional regulator